MITKEFLENHIRGLLKEKTEINTRIAAMGGGKGDSNKECFNRLMRELSRLTKEIAKARSFIIFVERSSDEAVEAECDRIRERLEILNASSQNLYPGDPKAQKKHQAPLKRELKKYLKEYHFLLGK